MKVSTPLALALITAVLVTVGTIYYREYQKVSSGEPSSDSETFVAPDDHLPFHTEEEWTALQITQYLADLGSLSKGSPLQPVAIKKVANTDAGSEYSLRWDAMKSNLSVKDGIWNPSTYLDWATTILGKPDPITPPASGLECAKTLLTPSLATFRTENDRISTFLREHPSSPEGLAEAALLCGTIALNDYSGRFKDLRIPLNRIVAFLAAADALGLPTDNPTRQLADVIRLTLCGQQADALAALDKWPESADTTLKDWQAILRLRNTNDWRKGRDHALAGSLALKHTYFHALLHAATPELAMEFLTESKANPDTFFWRIANEGALSVSEGHVFTKRILEIEFAEITQAAQANGINTKQDGLGWLKELLDTPEGSPVTQTDEGLSLQVAGQNLMAGLAQRQFMQSSQKLYTFLNDNWGVSEDAAEAKGFLLKQLPPMRYTPFLTRMLARTDAERHETNISCEAIIKEHPELVTPCLWANLRRDENGNDILSSPDFHAWFHPEVPSGTAFETGQRLFDIGVGDENDAVWLRTLWERAPYSYKVAMRNAYLENGGTYENLSADIVGRWLAPQSGYDLRSMSRLAACLDGQADLYEEAMQKITALDPDEYEPLAEYFLKRGMDEKAAKYYLLSFEKANNRVLVANTSDWLVKYLFKNGDTATAEKVAGDAAETFSYRGLATCIWLLEAQGRWDKALETAAKLDARYNEQPSEEVACLIRLWELSPEKARFAGYDEKVGNLFPDGLKKVALADFTEEPVYGALLNGVNRSMVPFGLKKGMIVTALNGYRVENFAQYNAIRSLSSDPKMSFIVWDGKSYRQSEGELPGRRFHIDMIDYVKYP